MAGEDKKVSRHFFCAPFNLAEKIILGNRLKPVQIIVAFIKGVDAVRQNGDVFFCGSDIGHFAVAHQQKTGEIAG